MPLKPTFFRVQGLERVYPGYYRPALSDTPEADMIWMHDDTRDEVLAALVAVDRRIDAAALDMAARDTRGLTASRLCEFALLLGEVVVFTGPVDLEPYTNIRAGERGVVGRRHGPLGETEVFLELHHAGLNEMSNCLWIVPHQNDVEVLPVLRRRVPADNGPSDHHLGRVAPSTIGEGLRDVYFLEAV